MVQFRFSNEEVLEVEEVVAAESIMYAEGMMDTYSFVPVDSRFSVQLMSTIFDYLRKHTIDRPSNEEDLEKWVTQFLDVNTGCLCQLAEAADYFGFKGLLEKILNKVAEMIRRKSPEEIRELLHIENDFTSEQEMAIRDKYPWAFRSGHATFHSKKAEVKGSSLYGMSWDNMPYPLSILLLKQIVGLASYIRFSAVCRHWQGIAIESIDSFKPVPWLMLPQSSRSEMRRFYDMSTEEVYELYLPSTQKKKILGSNFGFLIMVDKDGGFTAIDPLFPKEYTLPPISAFQSQIQNPVELTDRRQVRDLFAIKATCSPPPLANQPPSDFTAMVINLTGNTTCLSYCVPFLQGSQWMFFEKLKLRWIDYVQGQFIAVSFAGSVYVCCAMPDPFVKFLGTIPGGNIGPSSFYTVECGGKILFVKKNIWTPDQWLGSWDSDAYHTLSFQLYELNEEGIVETHSIGMYTLFVGYNNAICLPPAYCYEKNSIYFTDDYHEGIFSNGEIEGGQDMGIYSLNDGTIKRHYQGICKSKFSLPVWIIPNVIKNVDC